VDPHAQRVTAA